jgi:lipopolysaccharide/colanic/teichoic acid biosynthesis glycosyltransferase
LAESVNHPSFLSGNALLAGRAGGALPWFGFLGRIRYQLLGATLFAVLFPAFLRAGFDLKVTGGGSLENTVAGTFVAMLFGYYLLRRVTNFPGTSRVPFVLVAFLISYGLAVALFFFFRWDYSRFQFLASFAYVCLWFGTVGLIEPRLRRPRLVVLPFGGAAGVMRNDWADWIVASTPGQLPSGITGIVADLRADLATEWERYIAQAALSGVPVYHWKQIAETLNGTVDIEHLSENTLGSLLPSSLYLRLKRMIDCFLAILALPVVALIALPTALAIRLLDGGPVFFFQERMGLGARPFTMIKFRTMRSCGGEERLFTEENDQRITRVGRVLRRYRIDELPQILNILRGEMSWIGPRPEAVPLAEWYESQIPFYAYRHIVRPGITGWAQVHQGNVAEIEAATGKLHYDFFYIKYFSPWLDVLIVAKTVGILLTGRGAR